MPGPEPNTTVCRLLKHAAGKVRGADRWWSRIDRDGEVLLRPRMVSRAGRFATWSSTALLVCDLLGPAPVSGQQESPAQHATPSSAAADAGRDPELETARALYQAANASYQREDYVRALELLERAFALYPTSGLLFNIAQAQRMLGRCEAARVAYVQYLEQEQDPERRVAAVVGLDRLGPCDEGASTNDPANAAGAAAATSDATPHATLNAPSAAGLPKEEPVAESRSPRAPRSPRGSLTPSTSESAFGIHPAWVIAAGATALGLGAAGVAYAIQERVNTLSASGATLISEERADRLERHGIGWTLVAAGFGVGALAACLVGILSTQGDGEGTPSTIIDLKAAPNARGDQLRLHVRF